MIRVSLVILLVFLSLIGYAQEQSQITDLQESIDQRQTELLQRQNEIEQIEQALGSSKAELETKIANRDQLSEDLATLKLEHADLQKEVNQLQNSITNREIELNVLESQFKQLRDQARNLLRHLYRINGSRFSRSLSQLGSMHEFQVKNYYLSLLSKRDLELINNLEEKTNTLAATQLLQRQQLNEANLKSRELEEHQKLLEDKRLELDKSIVSLESSQAGRLALRASKLKDEERIENSISQAQKDLSDLQRQLEEKKRQAAAANTEKAKLENAQAISRLESRIAAQQKNLPALNSSYIYPIESPSLSTGYGNGFFGLALVANSAGAAVFATQAGVVQDVTNMGANDGYLVTILHADGITTAYLNLQNPVQVNIGSTVEQKQIIGYLGGGSLTKANMLKFYTYKNGNPIDPAKVLGY